MPVRRSRAETRPLFSTNASFMAPLTDDPHRPESSRAKNLRLNTSGALQSGSASAVDVQSLGVEEVDRPCSRCDGRFAGTFYRLNGKPTCEPCAKLERDGVGRPVGRLVTAVIYGVVVAAVVAVCWAGLAWVTDFEPTFLAIAAGFFVGGAVRAGARARGGLGYQLLAMGLTYAAVSAAYAPAIVEDIQHTPYAEIMGELKPAQAVRIRMLYMEGALEPKQTDAATREAGWADALLAGSLDGDHPPEFEDEEGKVIAEPEVTEAERIQVETAHREFASLPTADIARQTWPRALAAPFEVKGVPFYIFVVSFVAGLWFAWRRNHRERSVVTGPFGIGEATA
jgi:hypothetical protein